MFPLAKSPGCPALLLQIYDIGATPPVALAKRTGRYLVAAGVAVEFVAGVNAVPIAGLFTVAGSCV